MTVLGSQVSYNHNSVAKQLIISITFIYIARYLLTKLHPPVTYRHNSLPYRVVLSVHDLYFKIF